LVHRQNSSPVSGRVFLFRAEKDNESAFQGKVNSLPLKFSRSADPGNLDRRRKKEDRRRKKEDRRRKKEDRRRKKEDRRRKKEDRRNKTKDK